MSSKSTLLKFIESLFPIPKPTRNEVLGLDISIPSAVLTKLQFPFGPYTFKLLEGLLASLLTKFEITISTRSDERYGPDLIIYKEESGEYFLFHQGHRFYENLTVFQVIPLVESLIPHIGTLSFNKHKVYMRSLNDI